MVQPLLWLLLLRQWLQKEVEDRSGTGGCGPSKKICQGGMKASRPKLDHVSSEVYNVQIKRTRDVVVSGGHTWSTSWRVGGRSGDESPSEPSFG